MTRSPEDDAIINYIFDKEGRDKFTNDPADAGGATKWGVTQAALARHRGHPVTVEDVKNLEEPEAREIVWQDYVVKYGFDKLTAVRLRYAMVDFTYLFGADDSIPALQETIGVTADGHLGPVTLNAANAVEARGVVNRLAVIREKKHIDRVVNELRNKKLLDDLQAKWLRGWSNRTLSFVE